MAPRATLKHDTLVALGAERLATLILDEVSRNSPFKRIVTAASVAAKGPDAVAALIDRRLGSLERARGFVDYDRAAAFAADLASIVAVAAQELGSADPAGGAERLLRFLAGAGTVLGRVDDSSGKVQRIYEDAASRLAALFAEMRGRGRDGIVEDLVRAIAVDSQDYAEGTLVALVPSLDAGERGRLDELCRKAMSAADGKRGDWRTAATRAAMLRVRKAVADAADDVDAFMALDAAKPEPQRDSLGIAERLLKAGRFEEALRHARQPLGPTVRYVTREDLADESFDIDMGEYSRVGLEIDILAAMGDTAGAQALRLATFQRLLDVEMLREYVDALPDFEDDDALDAAFAHVAAHPRRHAALRFFLQWPRLDLAAVLVLDRAAQWEGRAYEVRAPAAATLEADHPVAAAILYRALINDILDRGRAGAYGHAARDLAKLDAMSNDTDAALLTTHDAYRAELRKKHGRKHGFWSRVGTG